MQKTNLEWNNGNEAPWVKVSVEISVTVRGTFNVMFRVKV